MTYLDILRAQLRIDEGVKTHPYVDTVGKVSIGIGRNLTDVGINGPEMSMMFENDIASAEKTARVLVWNFDALSDARKAVVVNMAFNLGYDRLSQFKNTLSLINTGRYVNAADAMLASKWAAQVGQRAIRLAHQMKVG